MQHTVLELFAGVGGFHAACPEAEFVAGVDISRQAQAVYQANFSSAYEVRAIESISTSSLAAYDADLWWMSPPCQPFSRRGKGRDAQDSRSAALLNIIEQLPKVRPRYLALENVAGFEASDCYRLLIGSLRAADYHFQTLSLCPTELGWPNKRPRIYLLASLKHDLLPWRKPPLYDLTWRQLLGWPAESLQTPLPAHAVAALDSPLNLSDEEYAAFRQSLDRVPIDDATASTACFTSSYGAALRHSGSYLEFPDGCRRFSPSEVGLLLGFPADFRLSVCDQRTAWKLLGNSLSIPAVRYVMSHLPNGQGGRLLASE